MKLIVDISCRGVVETLRLHLEEGQELVVGRDNKEILLRKDRTLSRNHFSLRFLGDTIEVSHHSGTNPTLISPFESNHFRRVEGTATERRACRIIAGHHRFVAAVESFESATVSGDVNEIWSDCSDEIHAPDEWDEGNQDDDWHRPAAPQNNNETLGLARSKPESGQPVFTWDDESQSTQITRAEKKKNASHSFSEFDSEPAASSKSQDDSPRETKVNPPLPVKCNDSRQPKPPSPKTSDESFSDDFFD